MYFLPQLLSEGYEYLQNCLTGSLLNVPLTRVPFNRDVPIGNRSELIAVICETLSACQDNGALILAPQDALSLTLKTCEQRLREKTDSVTLRRLQSILDDENWFSLLDESHSIPNHKGQLVYAMGSCVSLPQGSVRWQCIFQVLEARHGSELATALSDKEIASKRETELPGSMNEVYLIEGTKLDGIRQLLRTRIAETIIAQNREGWKWMGETKWKEVVIELACRPEIGFEKYKNELSSLRSTRRHQVLSMRAMLAFGVLEMCLTKRHRVSYGIDRRETAICRVAVPFRSSETPSTRSEFAHSDAQILYTTLSYAYDGLTEEEFYEAWERFAAMGSSARMREYDSWIELSRPRIPKYDFDLIDKEQKVDPSSRTQFKILYNAFRKNFRTVCFFLQECVLPTETMAFPQQMKATSWWLSDCKSLVGFSGTDDSKRLLPLHVKQTQPDVAEILGTNGEMCCRIVESEVDMRWDSLGHTEKEKLWEKLLHHSVGIGAAVLIDCGALLTGAKLEKAAEYASKLLIEAKSRLKGVVFFCNTGQEWLVTDHNGQK